MLMQKRFGVRSIYAAAGPAIFALHISGAVLAGQPAPGADARVMNYVAGRVLVQPRAGLPGDELDKLIKTHGGKRTRHLKEINVHVVELPPQANEIAVVKALRNNPHIKFAELDEIVTPQMTLGDPYVSSSYHLAKISAPAAWDSSTGSGVVVAILDTGVDAAHPDLAQHLVPGWNIIDNNSNTTDMNGHGTATAGTVGEIGSNGIGGAGVSWNARIMPVRIADANAYSTFSLIASGITWAADHGAKVASISYKNLGESAAVISAAQYMRGKGGVVVVAAGNEGTLQSTAASSYLTTVAATDSNDARASFSNYGAFVDVAAPGVTVNTTLIGSSYGWGTGTSFSTPIVAGVYALMAAANPALAPATLDNILFSTADDLGAAGYDIYYGYGRVNAARAVTTAKSTTASDTTSPVTTIASPSTGAKVAGNVLVNVNASDNVAVTKVELYAGNKLVATDLGTPYGFSWNTSAFPDGTTTLYSRAYDAAGNVTSSAPVSVTVANDTIAPTVAISNPTAGAKVSGVVSISVSATDNKAVSKISLLIDGKEVAVAYGSTLSYAWSVPMTSKKRNATSSTITARAFDGANNMGSTSVTVSK